MRRTKTALIIAVLLVSALPFVQKAEATLGEAKVYIICLDGVPGGWVDNCSRVKDGAIEACMLQGQYIHRNVPLAHPKRNVDYPPYYDATPYIVTGWSQYENIVKSYSEVIVVNTHGEYLPVPSDYYYNKAGWVDEIADAMLNRRVTWVHVGGYPFNLTWHQNGQTEIWDEDGFKRLMSHINKVDVDCWPPAPISETENKNATMQLNTEQQIGISWQFERIPEIVCKLVDIDLATLGRPLKINDFKEYLIMPLFKYQDYYAGAVIAFAQAGARYTDEHGCGAYVHIGARHLYDGGGNPFDADFGRGFIGTAAALWVESMGFDAKMDAKQGGSPSGPNSQNASLVVQPSISGVRESGTDLIVTMTFAIYGATQSCQPYVFCFENARFFVEEVSGSDWSDVEMRVDLGLSREGDGDGLMLSGLYDEGQAPYGLAASSLMWILGTPKLLAAHPIAAPILWGIGGVKLLAAWIEQGYTEEESGVGPDFDPYIYFRYLPKQKYTVSDGKGYYEFMTLTTLELLIPTSGKTGWHVLPLEYKISALPTWYYGASWLDVNDTLEIAIWLGAGEDCQSDAGSNRDATSSNPVSVAFPGSYHGYLGGGDNDDWYTFTMESGEYIAIHMNPPPFVDFDLELYRPDDTLKAESNQSAGATDTIRCMTECGGTWKLRTYKVQGSGVYSLDLNFWVNHQPNTPSQPYGPSSGYTYTFYSYSTSTTDPDGDRVKYQFSWGDGSYSTTDYYNSGVTVYASHSWSSLGYKSVKVKAYDGYVWSGWSSIRTVHISSGGGGGGDGCPTLYMWNGSAYVDYGVIDIHDPSGEDMVKEVSISKQDLAVEYGKVKLRLEEGWLGLNYSESVIDQVKLYAIDEDGKLKLCPLTTAVHSRLGNIREYIVASDDVKAQTLLLETIDLTFKVRKDSQSFIFIIEGCNQLKN